jgi:drug/metabolite transporter (DMT)-like permease
MPKLMKSRWFTLTIMVLLCGGVSVSTWVRGEHSKALQVLGLTLAIALGLLAAGRSKRFRRQLFDTDERYDAITFFAGMWAGWAFFLVVFICFLVENARGHSGEPYYWLSGSYVVLFILFGIARSVRK